MVEQIEIVEEMGKLNELIVKESRRPDGSVRIQLDFSNCISKTDQSAVDAGDINKLMKKHSPDEIALMLAARKNMRPEIIGHDFSREPDLQAAKNEVLRLNQAFDKLDPELKKQFGNVKEFLTFIDNPENVEKAIKLGLLTRKQIEEVVKKPDAESPVPPSENAVKA